jgi:hypothetical protein
MIVHDGELLKDWPWQAEQYEAGVDGSTLIAWRVRACVKPPSGIYRWVTVADGLDKPTAELIAQANAA